MDIEVAREIIGKIPVVLVEIDASYCANVYGVSPCTAPTGGSYERCFNTRATCRSTDDYIEDTITYTHSEAEAVLGIGFNSIPDLIGYDLSPTRITGDGLGIRASVSLRFKDFPHHDRGTDPYISTRDYDPVSRGTYWGKWVTRNKYYQNRIVRISNGFMINAVVNVYLISETGDRIITEAGEYVLIVLSQGFDLSSFQSRSYVIDKIDGPDKDDIVTITAKDMLKLADDKRAQCPKPSPAELSADIDDVDTSCLISEASEADYPSGGGYVRIGAEIIQYATRSVLTLTSLTRGAWGSTAEAHSEGDAVQLCAVFDGVNVVDIVTDLCVNYANIPSGFIPSAEWEVEKAYLLASHNLTAVISKPTGVTTLLGELAEQCLFYQWWDDINQLVKLVAIGPLTANDTPTSLNESAHLIAGSVAVKDDPDKRLSKVVVNYARSDYTEDDSFQRGYVQVDADAESAVQYGESRVKVVNSRWFAEGNKGQAIQFAGRTLVCFRDNPKIITFDLTAKDSDINTGSLITVTSRKNQDEFGNSADTRYRVTYCKEDVAGTTFKYQAISDSFDSGRYGFITEDDAPDYGDATTEEKLSMGFICLDTGLFTDGTQGYKVI